MRNSWDVINRNPFSKLNQINLPKQTRSPKSIPDQYEDAYVILGMPLLSALIYSKIPYLAMYASKVTEEGEQRYPETINQFPLDWRRGETQGPPLNFHKNFYSTIHGQVPTLVVCLSVWSQLMEYKDFPRIIPG